MFGLKRPKNMPKQRNYPLVPTFLKAAFSVAAVVSLYIGREVMTGTFLGVFPTTESEKEAVQGTFVFSQRMN